MKTCRSVLTASVAFLAIACTGKEEARFDATWESLQAYECPEWFRDAKFGIYLHWGPYSASLGPRNTDWYSRNMYKKGSKQNVYHEETYGSLKEFGYKDFIPMFTAENFDPEEWAELFVESGARFAGPVAEHADGFAMWDSEITKWNAKDMGPKRDVVAELEKAIRAKGLKFMTSFHHQWKWGWYPTMDTSTDTSNPEYEGLYGPPVPNSAFGVKGRKAYNPFPAPSHEFAAEWRDKVEEVVEAYSPDMIWFDNRMQILPEKYIQEMAAHFYNHSEAEGLDYVLTFKRPDMPLGTGTVDLERSRMPEIYPEPWLMDSSISRTTWSYAGGIEYYSTARIIHDLADVVSKNGNMLLNLAPMADGTIPEEQKRIMREIGAWLKVNGEAIYGTRPWLIYGEGPTETLVGHLSDLKFDGFKAEDIRFTTKDGVLYAIAFGWPEDGKEVKIKSLSLTDCNEEIAKVSLLGHRGKLKFEQRKEELAIQLPKKKPGDHAFVFKILIK
ncbi:alpha-L-fucosidase [Pelagicoccus mobilis]|uniref:alpha-L-fucosidase n=1 Tax=Pelagicoccus mobilis TaxID=415221 RepID=A0A934RR08_9BACT|nr:alpha-L-fucosidase [Pelagicoccus mobilis]MBK1875312.1 alpha-L-fucosidase [Pelagicoccus mobilis]